MCPQKVTVQELTLTHQKAKNWNGCFPGNDGQQSKYVRINSFTIRWNRTLENN